VALARALIFLSHSPLLYMGNLRTPPLVLMLLFLLVCLVKVVKILILVLRDTCYRIPLVNCSLITLSPPVSGG
jgi:hypothetical protein